MSRGYGIFRKEIKVLLEHVIGAFAIQILLIVLITYITKSFYSVNHQNVREYILPQDWMPKVQLAINAIIALVAAGFLWAEETAGDHHRFLSRLPVSRLQMFTEKVLAGLCIITCATALQYAFYAIWISWGIQIWDLNDPTLLYMITVSLSAYIIGIAISIHVKQILAVILGGLAVVYSLQFYFMAMQDRPTQELVFYYLLFVSVIFLFISMYAFHLRNRWNAYSKFVWMPPLLYKQQRFQNAILLFSLILIVFVEINPFRSTGEEFQTYQFLLLGNAFRWRAACFLLALMALLCGLTTYSQYEKDGIRSVLYHHPISLHRLYWSKFSYGLAVAAVCSLGLSIIVSHMVKESSAYYLAAIVAFLSGLFLYTIAVVCTHLVKSQVSAFLYCIPVGAITMLFMAYFSGYNLDSMANLTWINSTLLIRSLIDYDQHLMDIRGSDVVKSVLWIIGFALIGWRIATDRTVLTGSGWYRAGYFCRLYLFMQSIIIILLFTGFRDLLYLITGVDLGIN